MKKFITVLLSFVLYFNTFSAAHAGAEKWELIENVYDKSKNVLNVTARKVAQTAANDARYKVQVPVNASTLGGSVKTLLKGGLAVAAITALVEGVGWIIDEGSKTIMKPKPDQKPNFKYIYIIQYGSPSAYFQTLNELCTEAFKRGGWGTPYGQPFVEIPEGHGCVSLDPGFETFRVAAYSPTSDLGQVGARVLNPDFDPNQEPEFIPVSDSELGNEVLGNGTEPNSAATPNGGLIAEGYNPNNQTKGGAETDTALDNAPPQPDTPPKGDTKPKPNVDTDGDGKPDAYDPTKPSVGEDFTLPAFCDWAVTVCTWYSQYKVDSNKTDVHRETEKSFWEQIKDSYADSKAKIKTAYDDAKEYFTKDRDDKDKDDLDIPVPTNPPIDSSINFGGSCPADKTANINMGVGTIKMDFTYTHICTVASDIRGIVIFCGFFIGALIIGGIKQ